jgi:hypothetical protein
MASEEIRVTDPATGAQTFPPGEHAPIGKPAFCGCDECTRSSTPLPVYRDGKMTPEPHVPDIPASGEVRVTDLTTGAQKGSKPERFDLIPVGPLTEVARVYGKGAAKYAERNWERGYAWHLSYAAMQRHVNLFWAGNSIDDGPGGTGCHHLACAMFHLLALMEFEARGTGTDDRATGPLTVPGP